MKDKDFIESVLQGFENTHHVVFRDQEQARQLIKFAKNKALIEVLADIKTLTTAKEIRQVVKDWFIRNPEELLK